MGESEYAYYGSEVTVLGRRRGVLLGTVMGLASISLVGCGTQSSANLTSKFMTVDSAAQTVTLHLVAGYDATDNYRNFDGYSNGQMTINVPVGYTVNLEYENKSGIPTDVGVYAAHGQLAFKGAGDSIHDIFENPAAGILPGSSEKLKFTASQVGTYQIANYADRFPQTVNNPYQNVDMWDVFNVTNGGSPSITVK